MTGRRVEPTGPRDDKGMQPAQPGQAGQPGQPGHPGQPGNPGQPGQGTRPADDVPEQIQGAAQAWFATVGMQVAAAFTTLAINLLNPRAIVNAPGVGDMLGDFTDDQKVMVARVSAVLTTLITLAFCGFFAWVITRMRKGAMWARFVLVAGSVYLAIQLLPLYLGGAGAWEEAPIPLKLADGSLMIASAVAAIAATILVSGRNAMEFFTRSSGSGGNGGDKRPPGRDNGNSGMDGRGR